ncbi:RNA polymerase sigma factor [Candidatus Nitrospira inopinata]|jgi:RNA polymerase sigma-70 factor (ECF subfamily)|uniref:Putative RNA polymerase sigma factor 70 n=1 Tax=Candidatus Nitrospira inopinata TaxID=1715989 RepID=A0A0S4KU93_9BACT|nr:sigma-70 family RNA polymerase sigma factor [Candidatus Nitrospira inopinata]CUQ67927.1 putative RNA polymerase sigma factor 70 [Candidatus Nitrospira inopinata]
MTFSTVLSKPASPNSSNPMSVDVAMALVENRQVFLRVLARRMRSAETAEEVLQQFYLRALSKASEIKQQESIVPWLFRVLNSTLADFYRGERARRHGEGEYAHTHPESSHESNVDTESVCKCFYQLLPMLKPEYAEVLQRVDLSDDSRGKVAEALGITTNLVRVRLHRARQALRKVFLASCEGCEQGFMNCECAHKGNRHV